MNQDELQVLITDYEYKISQICQEIADYIGDYSELDQKFELLIHYRDRRNELAKLKKDKNA